ncbi:MAG: type I-G CRISPR-associated RAMP protein Csb1/Cas7g [Acidimicrobiia bacterium]
MPNRQILTVALRNAIGSRFQPTGFPDLGPARFERPRRDDDGNVRWEPALLVESAQSMANRLEAVGWDEATQRPVPALSGLPYVRVVHAEDGRYLTSSRTEAHRLAAGFVKDGLAGGRGMREVIKERLGLRDDTPLAPRDIARAVLRLDPLCLVHGVFFAEPAKVWPGQPKIARALTAFVEAYDVKPAESGGVKKDAVSHAKAEGQGAGEGYGFVPYHRTEWTAAEIVVSFSLDLGQLAAYGLSPAATELLATIARFEIRSLLDAGLRLRTACDLMPAGPVDGLAQRASLEADLRQLTAACAEELGSGEPLEVVWSPKMAKA